MKKMSLLVLGSLLFLGAAACSKGSDTAATDDNGIRSEQRESDDRAREQRDDMNPLADDEQQTTGDLAVDVRNSLESNLPGSRLSVDVDDESGMATIDGTVLTQEEFDEIEPLAMAVKGIKSVDVNAEIDSN
ncbi:MAG: BON domain-containing protein [Elainellaceae cyanobacterium]